MAQIAIVNKGSCEYNCLLRIPEGRTEKGGANPKYIPVRLARGVNVMDDKQWELAAKTKTFKHLLDKEIITVFTTTSKAKDTENPEKIREMHSIGAEGAIDLGKKVKRALAKKQAIIDTDSTGTPLNIEVD